MTQAGRDNSLIPVEVLTDLLGSEDFPAEVLDPEAAAQIILQRLADAGFRIVPLAITSDDVLVAGMQEVRRLRAEVDRLQEAKRRAAADERAKEAVELRRRLDERS
jgi:hypothetical protein